MADLSREEGCLGAAIWGACVVLAVLKLAKVAAISWWVVFSPIWVPVAALFGLLALIVVAVVVFVTTLLVFS